MIRVERMRRSRWTPSADGLARLGPRIRWQVSLHDFGNQVIERYAGWAQRRP